MRSAVVLALLAASPLPATPPTNRPPPQPRGPRSTPNPPFAQLLERPVTFSVNGDTLKDAFSQLSTASGLKVEVEWASLAAAGIGGRTPGCRLTLRGVPTRQAIGILIEALCGRSGGIVVEPDEESRVLRVVSAEDRRAVLRPYEVADLLAGASEEDLRALIIETVDPDSWRDNGGSVGDVSLRGRTLFVTQTSENQWNVASLLAQLRADAIPAAAHLCPDPAVAALDAAMDRPVEVSVNGRTLHDAVQGVADAASINVLINDRELEAAGIDAEAPVRLPRARMTPRAALETLAAATAVSDRPRLQWARDAGVLRVSHSESISGVETRCYDVRPAFGLRPGSRVDDERMERVVKVLQDTVDPDSWRDNGGAAGVARPRDGWMLVVTQTPENQRRVAEFFGGKMRR